MKPPFFVKQIHLFAVRWLFALLFLAIGMKTSDAQSFTPEKLEVIASAISDGTDITIRWQPLDYTTLKWGQEHGYRLERLRIDSNATSGSQIVVDSNITLLPEPQWQPLRNSIDMAEVAYTLIFKDSLGIEFMGTPDFLTVLETRSARESLVAFLSIATDRELDVAIAAGHAFIDSTAEAGADYLYFVTPNNVPTATTVVKGKVEVSTDSVYSPPVVTGVNVQSGDSLVVVGWYGNPEVYSSYLIERSSDNGVTWEQANESPYMAQTEEGNTYMSFVDSLSDNSSTFVYRVKGCSPFGSVGPNSDTVHVVGTPGPIKDVFPNLIDVEELASGELTINWEFPMSSEGDIQGFHVYRSEMQEGLYEQINTAILTTSTRAFTDTDPMTANYYKVIVLDVNGYEHPSIPFLGQLEDLTAPSAPASISGSCSLSGTATITWARSPESDVAGYRVFVSNQQTGNFVQISSEVVKDTVYRYGLNLNTLSEEIFFKVKAVDWRENMSDFSPTCTVNRPDIIPPAPPVITNVDPEIGQVRIEWVLSSSEDVEEYKFQRKPEGSPSWVTLLTFDSDTSVQTVTLAYTDSTASVRRYWNYRLLARDDAGLVSSSKVITTKPVDDGRRGDIANFSGYSTLDVGTFLDWDYTMSTDPDLEGFQIFRSFDNNPMQSYKFLSVQDARASAYSIGSSKMYALVDDDIDFKIPVQTTYVSQNYVDASTVIINNSGTVTSNGSYFTIVPASTNTPANPDAVGGVTVNYWVMAKHMDGGYSPVSGVVSVTVY